MNVDQFFADTSYAIDSIFSISFYEHQRLEVLNSELSPLESATHEGYSRASFLALNPDLDDDNLSTAIYYDTYFGVDKQRYEKAQQLDAQMDRIKSLEFSIGILSSSILQYAVHALKIRFGEKMPISNKCRLIHGFPIVDLIWHGRNQSSHWETPLRQPAVNFFTNLATVDSTYTDFSSRPLASLIIKDLGWKNSQDLRNDILEI